MTGTSAISCGRIWPRSTTTDRAMTSSSGRGRRSPRRRTWSWRACNDARQGGGPLSSDHDIANLIYRYGEYVDLARFDELAELFRHGAIRSDRGSGDLRGDDVATFYRATNRVHADS